MNNLKECQLCLSQLYHKSVENYHADDYYCLLLQFGIIFMIAILDSVDQDFEC